MCFLRLKKCWDNRDGSLYLHEQNRFPPKELASYWSGVDAAIKFWDKTLIEVLTKKIKKNAMKISIAKNKNPQMKSTITKVDHPPSRNLNINRKTDRHHYGRYDRNRYIWWKSHHSEIERGKTTTTQALQDIIHANCQHHHQGVKFLYKCHCTAVFHLFAPVRLPRPRVLTTVAPPSFFFSRSRLRFNRLPTLPGTVNDAIGMSLVTSYGARNDVTAPFRAL